MPNDNREPDDELLARFREAISGMSVDELGEVAGQLLSIGRDAARPEPAPSRRKPRREDVAVYQVRVDLEDARPPIWRRLDLRSDVTLATLHHVLQAAFAWTDSHLHRFALGDSVFDRDAEFFLCPWEVEDGEVDGVPAKDVRLDETLAEPGDVLRYCYDYGDSWDLAIRLEQVRPLTDEATPAAVCLDGRRAGPPEDCGGIRDAESLAEVLDDPAAFDVDEVNQALANPFVALLDGGLDPRLYAMLGPLRGTTVGDDLVARAWLVTQRRPRLMSTDERAAALRPFLWFLDHVGADGLPLTAAGYLKPVDVSAAAEVVPDGPAWYGAKNRETDTYPVLAFRHLLQQVGLLRKYRGRLLLTKAGSAARGNPAALWRQLVDRLPVAKAASADVPAGLLTLVYAASAPDQRVPFDRVAFALTDLGWRDGHDAASAASARHAASATLGVLQSVAPIPRELLEPPRLSPLAAELAAQALLAKDARQP